MLIKKLQIEFQGYATFSFLFPSLLKRLTMKRILYYLLIIPLFISCSPEMITVTRDLNNRTGTIQFHGCFCGQSAYRYLIAIQDTNDTLLYNPVNLAEDYKVASGKIVFSADLLNDSSIVYRNTPTDALVEDFKVRNIKLTFIRKCSNLLLNDTLELHTGKIYTNYENRLSIQLDSVTEDSRCPYNVECVWAGNAIVKFEFITNNKMNQFSLNTSAGFITDTIISGFKIQLIELKPYPVYPNPILQKDYVAKIKITRQN